MFQYIILLALFSCHFSNSYVLLQVVNNNKNESDVRAYVHKVVPSVEARRDSSIDEKDEKVRRFEIKKRAEDEGGNPSAQRQETLNLINQVFAVVKAIANGPEFRTSTSLSFIDKALDVAKAYVNAPEFRSSKTMKYMEKVIDIVKDVASGPKYRSGRSKPNMKTDLVHLKGDQPSLLFEVKPNFFVDFVKKVLSTQLVERYMDDMGLSKPDGNSKSKGYYKKKYASRYSKYT